LTKRVGVTRGTIHKDNGEQGDSNIACFCCGVCCASFQAYLTLPEAREIAQRLVLSDNEFREKYTDKRWPGTDSYLLQHRVGACIFLEQAAGSKARLCAIHAYKPDCCRRWTAGVGQKECRQGLFRDWGLTVDKNGKPDGSPEAIQCFQVFLDSLQ
jgi:uncharacterized protein